MRNYSRFLQGGWYNLEDEKYNLEVEKMYMTEQEEIEKFKKEIGLTTNLLSKIKDQGEDIFSYLENEYYKNRLDKSYYAVLSYRLYELYSNDKFKRQIDCNGWQDYSKEKATGYRSFYRLFNREDGIILSGEVLNSSTEMLKIYKKDIGGKENISNIAKMYFNLVTTVGNIMPWPTGFNPNGGLDIVQNKFPKYLGLYEWIKVVGNKPTGDETEDEKEKCKREEWIRNFINNHYLQDFVLENKGSFEAIKFLNSDELEKLRGELGKEIKEKERKEVKKQMEKWWNLYFDRASKAIMKRSYRILTKNDPNVEIEFTNAFTDFCVKYGIKNEIEELIDHLSKYEDQKIKGDKFLQIEGKKIDDELQELKKLKEILQRKSEEFTN